MDAVKIEIVLPEQVLKQLEQRIVEAILKGIETKPHNNEEKRDLTKKEAASLLRMSIRNLDRYIAEGQIRVNRNKRTVRIPESEIQTFLKQTP